MDRTSLTKKLKSLAMAAAMLVVGAIALALGVRMGVSHGDLAQYFMGDSPADKEKAEAAGEGDKHDAAHEAAQQAHAEHVAMNGHPSQAEARASGGDGRSRHETVVSQLFGTYARAWDSLQDKVEALRTAELENERLRLENSHLRLQLEGLQFNCSAKDASAKTRAYEYKLTQETKSEVGRDLSSIAYRIPTNLVPSQLYTLGIAYFKAREDEKAAMIFTFLTGMDDNDTFKTPKNFLLTGISWYRLDNFATADRYFDRSLKAKETAENLQTLAHARMWKALTAQRTGKHAQSQFWLTEVIDHHPLSLEASWVNNKVPHPKSSEARRGVAADPE